MWGKQEERRTWKNIERISGILTFGIFFFTIHYIIDNCFAFPPIERISLGMLLFSTCQIETHLVFWLPSLDKFFTENFLEMSAIWVHVWVHIWWQNANWILIINEVANDIKLFHSAQFHRVTILKYYHSMCKRKHSHHTKQLTFRNGQSGNFGQISIKQC